MTIHSRTRTMRAFVTRPLAAGLATALAIGAANATPARPQPMAPTGGAVIPVTACTESALRTAVNSAGNGAVVDLSALTCSTITLGNGELASDVDFLTLHGPTDHVLTIDGGLGSRIITHVGNGRLTIDHLRLANGASYYSSNGYFGGCVYARNNVTVAYSTVTGCQAKYGGGITTALGNIVITGSTISDNVAKQRGGALLAPFGASIDNSTISGNVGYFAGGGIFVNDGGSLSVHNSTIAFNVAGSTVDDDSGGGIRLGQGASADIVSSILRGNTNEPGASDSDIRGGDGASIDGGHSLIGSSNLAVPGDTLNGDPGLAPLADNGGPTWTHALSAGSIAIDTGVNPDLRTFDQRGFARTVGAGTDIGAYELGGGVPRCSDANLRNAVVAAGDGDTVDLGVFHDCSITLLGGAIPIGVDDLTLHGPADGSLMIDGKYVDRVFDHTGTGTLAIDHMTLTHGNAGGNGGCASSAGSIAMDSVTVTACSAGGSGGGVFAAQSFTATGSTISNNTAGTWAGGAGALHGDIDIRRSTFSGNHAGTVGGGPYSFYGSHLRVTNSTISGNIAVGKGGGIAAWAGLTVHNSTIAFNTSLQEPGGGIHIAHGPVEITSTIVSDNNGHFAAGDSASDIYSDDPSIVVDGSHDLIGSSVLATPTDTLSTDPQLAPLADNGGPTMTHAIGAGSPAFDAGTDPDMLDSDQRYTGFVRVFSAAADIGAFELQAAPTAHDDAYTVTRDTPLNIAAPGVLVNDVGEFDQPLVAALIDAPAHGTLVLAADGGFNYLPVAGYTGSDLFTYTASDGLGTSAPATVTIEITFDDTLFADGFDSP
jgi:hypothetical protein